MFHNPGQVVSKFQFSKLFAQAWSKGMTIDNICSGFRKSGVFPFNPKVILGDLPTASENESNVDNSPQSDSDDSQQDDDNNLLGSSSHTLHSEGSDLSSSFQDHLVESLTVPDASVDFSPDKIQLFERRYENGYDMYTDREYVAWLRAVHPDSESSVATLFSCDSTVMKNSALPAIGE